MSGKEKKSTLKIKRYHPEKKPAFYEETFQVPCRGRATLLQAFIHIYENNDPTFAFSYSCRYKKCGLCGIEVNGLPSLACVSLLEEKQEITPLSNLPLFKDLVVDRRPLENILRREKVFLLKGERSKKENLLPGGFPPLKIHPYLKDLFNCLECLCCHAWCPALTGENLEHFGGPYVFVKLAQLHLDPRDSMDRQAQARRLGIERCWDCGRCRCPQGINIYRQAILPLSQQP